MCGIAGILDFRGKPPVPEEIERITHEQRHRGPDGQGFFNRDGIALGHRRLSIIDVSGGQQPLSNEAQDIWLTFNGEIYNYRELRADLISYGHQFRTQSDSEVIVHAYEQWGKECVQRFRGMFAFAIADFRERILFLARDHFGIKPLYYRVDPDRIAFASELSPLARLGYEPPRINEQAIEFFLRYRYIPAPSTIYDRIQKLPAAHTLTCRFDGRESFSDEYWRLSIAADDAQSDELWFEQFAEVVDSSVATHLVADVPFGAFLSGGVDSTLIAASMAQQLQAPLKVFSIGFDDENYSEIKHAQRAATQLGVELYSEIVRPDVVAILDELFQRYGEPFADTSAIPTWYVSQLARQHVPMVLSGDGADEAFAGYARYDRFASDRWQRDLLAMTKHPKQALRRLAARLSRSVPDRLERWQQNYVGVFTAYDRRQLWRPGYQTLVDIPCSAFAQAHRRASHLPPLEYAQYVDIKTYLPGDILTKVDVASMCHGLEVRTPFTDRRVMEFAATLPSRWRRRRRLFRAPTLKPLPKHCLSQQFSTEFVHRRKQGFAIPEAKWLVSGSTIRERLEDVVRSPGSRLNDYFNHTRILNMLAEFDERGSHATSLWSLLILGMWMDRSATIQTRMVA